MKELLAAISPVEASWHDEHADRVIRLMGSIPESRTYNREILAHLLDEDFEAALTLMRLVLDLPKDEFVISLRAELSGGSVGVSRFRKDRDDFLDALESLGVAKAIARIVTMPVSWQTVLVERLKAGRGSAIKGQSRGRLLEDVTERIVRTVFGKDNYDVRCRFLGATGTSTEKADFAIPSKDDPRVLIEVKAYGATGSKQTDVLGDMARIVEQKRHDTHLLLVTDGVTWKARASDLGRLVEMQNQGRITRIYTRRMEEDLRSDLETLKHDHGL